MHLFLITATSLAALSVASVLPTQLKSRDLGVATVDLGVNTGSPAHLASGIIYGIPDTPNQIPSVYYTDIGFNYGRAGGAQIAGTGWIYGKDKYNTRFRSALSNWKTCRQYNARFQLILPDLWGADTTESDSAPFPGDNGDWSRYAILSCSLRLPNDKHIDIPPSYDQFLTYVINNITANKMTTGLDLDLWNEPDNNPFWKRSQDQWLQMWGRGYARLRYGCNRL